MLKVLPNMASIVDIKAVSYDVCGVARTVSSGYRAKVRTELLVLPSAKFSFGSYWTYNVTCEL